MTLSSFNFRIPTLSESVVITYYNSIEDQRIVFPQNNQVDSVVIGIFIMIAELFMICYSSILGFCGFVVAICFFGNQIEAVIQTIVQAIFNPPPLISASDQADPIFQRIAQIAGQYLQPLARLTQEISNINTITTPSAPPFITYGTDATGHPFFAMKLYYCITTANPTQLRPAKTGYEYRLIYRDTCWWSQTIGKNIAEFFQVTDFLKCADQPFSYICGDTTTTLSLFPINTA